MNIYLCCCCICVLYSDVLLLDLITQNPQVFVLQMHIFVLRIIMATVQVRIDDEENKDLDELAKKLEITKSELLRKIIKRGKKGLLFDVYFEKLTKKEISVSRAAVEADLSIPEFMEMARKRGYTYFQYDPEELDRDLESLEE